MKVKFLGHSCFAVTSDDGVKVIIDPYRKGLYGVMMGMTYSPIKESADVVLITHNHPDHNNSGSISGNPEIIKEEGTREVKGITFKGIKTSHGFGRGSNIVYAFPMDGVSICHLGDLAHLLTRNQLDEIGNVDVLMIPIGGRTTINTSKASQVCSSLHPKVVIPMHFRNEKCRFPFSAISKFTDCRECCRYLDGSEIDIDQSSFSQICETLILEPAS